MIGAESVASIGVFWPLSSTLDVGLLNHNKYELGSHNTNKIHVSFFPLSQKETTQKDNIGKTSTHTILLLNPWEVPVEILSASVFVVFSLTEVSAVGSSGDSMVFN